MRIVKKVEETLGLKKKHGFFHDLKTWVISPGGIITIVLVLGVIWYVHHSYQKKKAA